MKKPINISIQFLRELFTLNSSAGALIWNERPLAHFKTSRTRNAWNTSYAGTVAGSTRSDGYQSVRISKRSFLVHRVIYAIENNIALEDVPGEIDHQDTNQRHNSPTNLRPASHSDNLSNIAAHVDNTSGFKGVSWCKRTAKWRASIMKHGKQYSLGYYFSPELASAAYASAANDLHGDFARVA